MDTSSVVVSGGQFNHKERTLIGRAAADVDNVRNKGKQSVALTGALCLVPGLQISFGFT